MMNWPWNRKDVREIWKWPHVFWVQVLGCWSQDVRSERARVWLGRFGAFYYAYYAIITATTIIPMVLKFVEGDLLLNILTVLTCLPTLVGLIKLTCLFVFRQTLRAAMNSIDEMFQEIRDAEEEKIVRGSLKRCWIMFTVMLSVTSTVTTHWGVRPLINALVLGEKTRIFETWPVLLDTWNQFAISYFMHYVGLVGGAHAMYIYDNMFFCISECILCHFALLKHRLQKLELGETRRSSSDMIHCVQYHTKLLRTCDLLRVSTTTVIISQSVLTTLELCGSVFVLTMTEAGLAMTMNLGEFGFLLTVIYFFYCWYANEIAFQCHEVCNAAYQGQWTGGTLEDKKSLQILMVRTEMPARFGGILSISLDTFITVFKATFSYYNFLVACLVTSDKN